jgi:hypothetical protein
VPYGGSGGDAFDSVVTQSIRSSVPIELLDCKG